MEEMQLRVTAKRRIAKFAEGANPETDEPYAIEEQEVVLTGDEAKQVLDQMGISQESALELAKGATKDGVN